MVHTITIALLTLEIFQGKKKNSMNMETWTYGEINKLSELKEKLKECTHSLSLSKNNLPYQLFANSRVPTKTAIGGQQLCASFTGHWRSIPSVPLLIPPPHRTPPSPSPQSQSKTGLEQQLILQESLFLTLLQNEPTHWGQHTILSGPANTVCDPPDSNVCATDTVGRQTTKMWLKDRK